MRKTMVAALASLLAVAAFAVPARPGQWRAIRLADGRTVQAQFCGDEFMSFWQAADGACYVKDGDIYRTANLEMMRMQAQQERRIAQAPRRRPASGIGNQDGLFYGEKRGIVILAQFTDMSFQGEFGKDYFNAMINEIGYTDEYGCRGSVRDYFLEQSGGRFDLTFDVVGPIDLKHDYAYYGKDSNNYHDMRAREMIQEAVRAAKDSVNFKDYDWDGDGYVEEVFVIYAGKGQADGGDANTVWPHKSQIQPLSVDGVRVSVYACGSELNGRGTSDGIGTICHEYSHCMGLPDMYDVAYGGNFGMGPWDIMASGPYNGGGYRPSGYTSIDKMLAGWLDPIELTEETSVTNMAPLTEDGPAYIFYNDTNPNEFILLENRQLTGFDDAQYGHGLLALYVDYDKQLWDYNIVNTTTDYYANYNDHQRCTIYPADNSRGERSYSDLAGDPFPNGTNDSLTVNSMPAPTTYYPNSEGDKMFYIAVTDIKENGDGTMSFNFRQQAPTPFDPSGATFYETFDQCEGTGGNDGSWSGAVAMSAFQPDYEGWTYNVAFGGDQCARFGSSSKPGSARTPVFHVDGAASFIFRAAPWGNDGTQLKLRIVGDAQITDSVFTLAKNGWRTLSTTIIGTGDFQMTFMPQKRLFLDDVTVKPADATVLRAIRRQEAAVADRRIFTLDGRYAGTDLSTLPRGIYIRGGKKLVK